MGEFLQIPAVPWAKSPEALFADLHTRAEGLSAEEAERRFLRIGKNTFLRRRAVSRPLIFLRQLMSPLIFLLIAAAALTVVLQEWVETAIILLAVGVNSFLGYYQEYRAEHTLEELVSYIKDRTRVVRDGHVREIDSSEIVPGDILQLSLGARTPADARLLTSKDLAVDESFLTGESLSVRKSVEIVSEGAEVTARTNMLFAGSLVVEGVATAVVTATGEQTEIGRIARLVSEAPTELTPLQRSLRSLAWTIFALVILLVAGLFMLGISRGEPILEMLLLSTATAVGAVPEALPIALTVILAVGVQRIASKRGVMRSLAAAETLGSTTLVMTDKTGTLTEAKMSVTNVVTRDALVGGTILQLPGIAQASDAQRAVLEYALLATEVAVENPQDSVVKREFIGRPLEVNIALVAQAAGVDVLDATGERRIAVHPFNSTTKFSLTFDSKTKNAVALGAPDVLLKRSRVSKDEYLRIEAYIQQMSAEGERLVGVARTLDGELSRERLESMRPEEVGDLEFMGLILLHDPVRKEAAASVAWIERHGARVVMLTGDLKGTAMAVGRTLGWNIDEGSVLTGEELRKFSDEELSSRIATVRIFSRVTPEDKLRICKLFQAQGRVVAMTGDGVNDAPSLKTADIGIAIGSGSDVAKSASDLVLLDDNFKTIVLAIEEGRRIITNIRKAFVYLMSNSLDVLFLIGGSLVMALPLPLTAVQIIWANFFTGSLPALAYAFEKYNENDSDSKAGAIFNRDVQVLTLGVGILTSFMLFLLYWGLLSNGVELEVARTVLFICFAGYILAAAFSFKNLHEPVFSYRLFDNQLLTISIVSAFLLIVFSVALAPLRNMLHLVPISPFWILFVLWWLALNVIVVEVAKWGLVRFSGKSRVQS